MGWIVIGNISYKVNEASIERLMHAKDERVQQLPKKPGQKKLGKSDSLLSLVWLNLFRFKFKSALHTELEHF
jgi:hypothetical protein